MTTGQLLAGTSLLDVLCTDARNEVGTFGHTGSNALLRMYDLNDPINRGYQMGMSNNAFLIKKYGAGQRSFVGIGSITNAPVCLEIHGTDAVLMPAGETSDRPLAPVQGHMRFNKTQQTFEGYANGNWGSLGGVKSIDQRTYITAENGGNLTFISNDATLLKIAATSNVTVYGNLAATGVGTTWGHITATSFVGIGSSITQLNAGNISTGTLALGKGGTGVGTAPANGQLLIGNGSSYALANITGGTGVSVANSSGSITLAIGQAVGIGSFVQFGSLGVGTPASGSAGELKATGFVGFGTSITQLNAGNIFTGILAVGRGGTGLDTAPTNGQLLIGDGSAFTLADITGGTGISAAKSAGSITVAIAQAVGIGSSVQFGSIGVGTPASGVAGEVKATGFVGFGTSIAQLNAGNIATGTLAVTRGGTGVGTSTGTGSVVLSASPTLTGTVTGDTFSGNGSLLTNLNASNVSTGALAVARGGTGTALTLGKVLVGNGTSPVLQPTNLHWDNTNSRLGIGNASPTQTLHVSGNITSTGNNNVGTQFLGLATDTVGAPSFSWTNDANTGMYRPGTDMLGIVTGGIERVRVLANGDVGIGMTAPESKVQINGTVNIRNFSTLIISSISAENNRTYVVNGITVSAKACGTGAGGYHSIVLDNTGGVHTWGQNDWGQLGNNNLNVFSSTPINVSTFGSLPGRTLIGVSAGINHTLAIDSTNVLHGWGANREGQLGINNSITQYIATPMIISTFGSLSGRMVVAACAGGGNNSIALDSTGAVHTWGINNFGQLGRNNTVTSFIPVNISTFGSLSGRTVVAIATSGAHTIALDSTSGLHTWGFNGNGQLGNNSITNSLIPVSVNAFGSLSGRTVVGFASGTYSTIAVDSTGNVHTWGNNQNGSLGNNSTNNSLIPVNVSSFGSLSGRKVVAVAMAAHSLALDSTGQVHAWGPNNNYQLGNNSTVNSLIPVNVSSFGSLSGRTVVAIACGQAGHNLALDSTGVLHSWGEGAFGMQGNNIDFTQSPIPQNNISFVQTPKGLGIGITPFYQLHLSSDSAAKPATSTWTVSSDERLKTEIEVADYDRCYEIVKSLDLKSYNWNSNIPQLMQSVGTDHHRLGWIAQDIEPIFPKAINVVPDLYGLSNVLNVNFDQVYAVRYGAVKKIIEKLSILMDKVDNMEHDILVLKTK